MDRKTGSSFRIVFRHLLPELRPYIWAILFSLSITGLVISADLLQPLLFKQLLDAATLSMNYPVVIQCLLFLLGLVCVRSVLSYWEIFARSKVGESISAQLRRKTFEHVIHLPLPIFHEMEDSALVHRIMHDCGEVGRVYISSKLLPMIAQVIQVLALIGFLIALNWQVGLASLLVFPLGWLISRGVTHRSHAQVIRLRTLVERGHGMLQEIFSCIREVRAVGNEAGEMRRWDNWLQDYGRVISRTTTQHHFIRGTLSRLIDWIGLCVVFGWGGWQLLGHHMTVGTLLAMSLYVQQLYTTLSALLSGRLETIEVANALEAIQNILQRPREWPDQGQQALPAGDGHLEFEDISFSYQDTPTIKQVSFHSAPGQMTGIVGPTGSGKSTLMHLCLRFYPVAAGKILLDGQDIAEIAPHVLRQHIGLVSQDIQLWNTTIRENLLYGLQTEVPWERVIEVCQKTCVDAFVRHLPQEYETVVGSRGVKLSGGEKQRIALARALLRDPKILLLDEATSALDALTERAITNVLLQMGEKKNRLLVAHRLATVQSADQVIVIANGKIVEAGDPHSLYKQNGMYATLYHIQKLGEGVPPRS
ncbi:ABC transporter ATP-binding protein [Ktedonobacter racemifer]|nr:ABC transporter ATP-binding protein [Ktedonobacter racemifer]